MSVAIPNRSILHQTPVLAALAGSVARTLVRRVRGVRGATPVVPGPEIVTTVAPRPTDLVRDYVRHVGGDPSCYRGTVPPHLFPQWGFPLATRVLAGLDYPLERVLNAGCRLEVNGPLPAAEPLEVRARLERIDDDGRRAVLHTRVATGPASQPDAVVGHMVALVPLQRDKRHKKEPLRVPETARELGFWQLGGAAGLEYAKLSGDFNPVHWLPAYARTFGFRSTILHGFATMARAYEGLVRGLYAGAVDRLRVLDVQFTSPLFLPARVGLYLDGGRVLVGDAPGGRAYLDGSFEPWATSC